MTSIPLCEVLWRYRAFEKRKAPCALVSIASAVASYMRAKYSHNPFPLLDLKLKTHVTLTRHRLQRTRRSPPPREHSPAPRDRNHRTRVSPAPTPAPVKEDPAVHSGSEEGEIEE
jgi:hypothetical protein